MSEAVSLILYLGLPGGQYQEAKKSQIEERADEFHIRIGGDVDRKREVRSTGWGTRRRNGSLMGVVVEQQLAIWFFVLSSLAMPALWILVCNFLARLGGWRRLADAYGRRTHAGGLGTRFRFQSGSLGSVTYTHVLAFGVGPEGIDFDVFFLFRPGHRAFRVPWSDLEFSPKKRGFTGGVEVSFAKVPGVSLTLSRSLAERLVEKGGFHPGLPGAISKNRP